LWWGPAGNALLNSSVFFGWCVAELMEFLTKSKGSNIPKMILPLGPSISLPMLENLKKCDFNLWKSCVTTLNEAKV
jgi:hypothetical protein